MRPDLERLLEASYRTVVERDLRTDAGGDLYDAPAALLMHGSEADPVFLLRQSHRAASVGPDLGPIHPAAVAALGRTVGPGRTRPVAGACARAWFHRRLPGRADREGWHAFPHLGRGGVDGCRGRRAHGQAALFREWEPREWS